MAIKLPWVTNRQEQVKNRTPRDHNTQEENGLLDIAQERFNLTQERKVDYTGKSLHYKWRELDQFYRGSQWLREDVPPNKSTPVMNFIFALTEAVIPRLTDNDPDFLILPRRSPKDNDLAEQLTGTQRYLWYANRMHEDLLDEAVMPALKYGTSVLKTVWDPDWQGVGDVRYSVVHPMNFFPDPRAYRIPEMDYCFTRVPKPLEYYLRRWPEKGHLVLPDNDWTQVETLEGRDQPSAEEQASLTEYWFRDENGDMCCMYYAGDIVLQVIGGVYDGSNNPVYRHNRFPFARLVDYAVDKEFWGIGEIELVVTLQMLINSLEAQVIDNTRLMANAEWIVDKMKSGLKEEDAWAFNMGPGNVIFTAQGGVEKALGVPIPPHITRHIEQLIAFMEQILGIHDVVQGRRPAGVRAASAIIALQESASIRIRRKAKHLQSALRELVEQSISLVLENYDEPRQVRIAGIAVPTTLNIREALIPRMMEMAEDAGMLPPTMPPGMAPEGTMPELSPGTMSMMAPPEEQAALEEQVFNEMKFPEFDIEVKIGPSVPYSAALLYEQAKEFYQLGAIDRQALLEATNFPNKEDILRRMEQQEAAAAGVPPEGGGEWVGERTF